MVRSSPFLSFSGGVMLVVFFEIRIGQELFVTNR